MAFVPGYEYDIFINYAQVDNEPASGADKGWVSTLADELKKHLAQELGRKNAFSLWRDTDSLSHHKAIMPEIKISLRQTAILMIILSPGYLASKWCQQEREIFLEANDGQPGSQVFIVERTETESSEKPKPLSQLLGYSFWIQDDDGQPPRTLGYPKPNPDDSKDKSYYYLLNKLANDLAKELRSLNPPSDTRPAVFLADVTQDIFPKQAKVREYLDQAGFRVLPEKPLFSTDTNVFKQAVNEELEGCKAFVQLLKCCPKFCF